MVHPLHEAQAAAADDTSRFSASSSPTIPSERTSARPHRPYERYRVSVEQYRSFQTDGLLIVRGLVSPEDIDELRQHSEDLMYGRFQIPGMQPAPPDATPQELERRYLRIHMLHREIDVHERFLLHPCVLDVLEALIGPDVMAMQSMFFLKFPGGEGQGDHQDSYYIPTVPDTLCGAWMAVDRADEENGCVHFSLGSHHEPVYPTPGVEQQNHGSALADLDIVEHVSNTDETVNTLSRIGARYRETEVPAVMEPGDVAFFGGHILHRSHRNRSTDRFRRSFVGHYANARSYTLWGGADGVPSNGHHILARGNTHLSYAQPRFGTACAANVPELRNEGFVPTVNMPDGDMMESAPMDMSRNDPGADTH